MQRLRLELYSKSGYSEKAAVNAKVAVTTATVRTTTTVAFALISTDTASHPTSATTASFEQYCDVDLLFICFLLGIVLYFVANRHWIFLKSI
jgi:hypothetical protein